MSNFYPKKTNEKATVCYKNSCATVEGDTARFVNTAVVIVTIVAASAALYKLFKSL